jgi:hypothetical protein
VGVAMAQAGWQVGWLSSFHNRKCRIYITKKQKTGLGRRTWTRSQGNAHSLTGWTLVNVRLVDITMKAGRIIFNAYNLPSL